MLCTAAAAWLWSSRSQNSAINGEEKSGDDGAPGPSVAAGSADKQLIERPDFSDQFTNGSGALVQGRVVDVNTGQPVPYVDVIFRRALAENTANSGADGHYSIELGSGSWQVRALGEEVYAAPQTLMVGSLADTMNFDIKVSRMARISGRVIDQNDQPVAGATVAFLPEARATRQLTRNFELVPTTTSGPDGGFTLAVTPGDVHISAELDRIKGEVFLRAVAPGSEFDDVVITLAPGVSVAGQVHDPRGQPVAGASVYAAVRVPKTRLVDRQEVASDEQGRFMFPQLTAGVVVLEARAPGFAPSDPTPFKPAPGAELHDVVLNLQVGGAISGRVVDKAGTPMAGVEIRAARKGSWRKRFETDTRSDGTFAIQGVAGGPFKVEAIHGGYATARRLDVNAPATDVELVLAPHGGIRGLVTDSRGQPVREFSVRVERYRSDGDGLYHKGKASKRFFADDGRFELYPLDPGIHDIVVVAPGYGPTRIGAIKVPPAGWGEGTAQLVSGTRMTGTVRSKKTGKLVAGARVSMFSGYEGVAVFTNNNGRFTISDIAPGRRSISVAHPDYMSLDKGGIAIDDGQNEIELELMPAAGEQQGVQLAGIGASFYTKDGALFVKIVLKGSPAARARLGRHDRLVAVDGISVANRSHVEVIEMIRGPEGTPVQLELRRGDKTVTHTIVRAWVEYPSGQSELIAVLAPDSRAGGGKPVGSEPG